MRLIEGEINALRDKVLDMSDLVVWQLEHVSKALVTLDYDLAQRIRHKEAKVDKFDVKIDKRCERIIALHQPVADDLRFVFSVIKINAFLEQIGDVVNGVARKICDAPQPYEPDLLETIALQQYLGLVNDIVAQSLRAYLRGDANAARNVFPQDDAIDDLHHNAIETLTERIRRKPEQAAAYVQLLLIVKSFEKIADFAVNIAEEAIFYTEGAVYKHTDLKYAYKKQLSEAV